MKNPVIAVIGSRGKMGHAFVTLFKKAKFRVLEVDTKTALTIDAAAQKADIIVVTVPISVTPDVMTQVLSAAKPGCLVTDLTSIKLPVEAAFKKSGRRDIEMIGLHPLFGPSMVNSMQDQVIAYCPYRAGKLSVWLLSFLKKQGALVKKTTARDHDEAMAVIQGITHFSAIASGLALKKLSTNIKTTREFSSPIYSLRLAMIGRILSQSPELYADIEIENPATAQAVAAYQKAIAELSNCVNTADKKGFIDLFNEAANFLGNYTKEAQRETDRIIKLMHKK